MSQTTDPEPDHRQLDAKLFKVRCQFASKGILFCRHKHCRTLGSLEQIKVRKTDSSTPASDVACNITDRAGNIDKPSVSNARHRCLLPKGIGRHLLDPFNTSPAPADAPMVSELTRYCTSLQPFTQNCRQAMKRVHQDSNPDSHITRHAAPDYCAHASGWGTLVSSAAQGAGSMLSLRTFLHRLH